MQSKPTQATKNKVHHLLDYLSTHPTFVVTYKASDMILPVDSNASYLVEPGENSRAGGCYYLSSHKFPKLTRPIHCMATLIKAIMYSAAEVEIGGLFLNATNVVSMRSILFDMGHPQPPGPNYNRQYNSIRSGYQCN